MNSTSASFWKFWTASTISSVGSGISTVAIPIIALTVLDASNFEVGLITAAGYAAIVLIGLPAGVIASQFPMRTMQVTMDSFRAAAMLTIPIAALLHALTIIHLLVVALLVGLASNLFAVANASFLPSVVPRADLINRNGLQSGTQATTQLIGPSIGGLLVQVIGAATIVVDAASYLVSATLLSRIPAAGRPTKTPATAPFSQQITEGLRYVFRHPVIRPCLFAATSVNFANGALLAVSPPFLLRTLGLPAGLVGVLMAAETIGSLTAAALTARLVHRLGTARAVLAATSFGALAAAFIPLASGPAAPAVFCAGTIGLAAGVTILSVVTRTHRQQVSPPALLTRVMASVRFVSWGAIPIGSILAGLMAQTWEPRAGLLLCASAAVLAPLSLWLSQVRHLHDLTDTQTTADNVEPSPQASART
jgi:MFS family permease